MIALDAATPVSLDPAASSQNYHETKRIPGYDRCFTYFALMVYSSSLADPIRVLRGIPEPLPGVSDPVLTISQSLILVLLATFLLIRSQRILPLLRYIAPYLMFFGICVASSLWSDFPVVTLRRSIAYGACIMFGVYCYDVFGLAGIVAIIARLAMVLAVASMICFIAVPAIGKDPTIGSYNAMRGVFPHKNLLAILMVLAIICCAYRVIVEKKLRAFIFSVPLLYLSILLSQSASSLIAATIVLILTGLFYLRPRSGARMLYIYFLACGLAAFIGFAILFPDELFSVMGRDSSLTGRLPIWGLIVGSIADRPLLGFGYAGFWNADSRETQYIWAQIGWLAPHAHNGYLEISVEVGLIGLALILFTFIRTIALAIIAMNHRTLPSAPWVLMFLILIILLNIDESQLAGNDVFNAIVATAMIEVGRWNDSRKTAPARTQQARRQPAGTAQIAALGSFSTRRAGSVLPSLAERLARTDPHGSVNGH